MAMINSPITNSLNVAKIKSLNTAKIIDLYKKNYNINIVNEFINFPTIDIYRCIDTHLKYYANYYELAGNADFYCQLSANYSGYYSENKWEFNEVMSYFNSETRVLEIGCGNGYFLKKLKNANVSKITGIEISPDAVSHCVKSGLNVIQSRVEEYATTPGEKFDTICSFQIFEHLPNVHSTIEKSLSLLNVNGLFIISVPNNDSLIFANDDYHTLNLPPHHVILWDEKSLRMLCEIYNLEMVKIHKSVAGTIEKSMIYKLKLVKSFGSVIGKLVHTCTRFFVKRVMSDCDGATIIAVFRKK
jgi:2-polyprenyl-3-methyl-5-hydroxy-6-metoxy-1,4-benzoquinol methylase